MPIAQRPKVTFEDPYMVFTLPLVEREGFDNLTEREQRGLDFIRMNRRVSRKQYEEHFGLTEKTAGRDLDKLFKVGYIDKDGKGKNVVYFCK